jgi:hypothetical protein
MGYWPPVGACQISPIEPARIEKAITLALEAFSRREQQRATARSNA